MDVLAGVEALPLLSMIRDAFLQAFGPLTVKPGAVHIYTSKTVGRVEKMGVNLSHTVPGKEQVLHQAVFLLGVSTPTVLCTKSRSVINDTGPFSLASHSHLILQTRIIGSLVVVVVVVVD